MQSTMEKIFLTITKSMRVHPPILSPAKVEKQGISTNKIQTMEDLLVPKVAIQYF